MTGAKISIFYLYLINIIKLTPLDFWHEIPLSLESFMCEWMLSVIGWQSVHTTHYIPAQGTVAAIPPIKEN